MAESIPSLFQQAVAAHQRGSQKTAANHQSMLAKAERLYGQILKAQPQHADARYNLALLLLQTARFAPALAQLQQLIERGGGGYLLQPGPRLGHAGPL
jgi:cytochrome c-type biogenesis protein CcmH/NrfG